MIAKRIARLERALAAPGDRIEPGTIHERGPDGLWRPCDPLRTLYVRVGAAGPRESWPPVFRVAPGEYRNATPDGAPVRVTTVGGRRDEDVRSDYEEDSEDAPD